MGSCRGEWHGGINMGGTGTGTETGPVRAGQQGRHAGENGERARQARAGVQGKWGPLVGHVPQYREFYGWEGADSIRFGTYNIRNRQNGGLDAALRGMSQANMDLGILQETKLTDGIYTYGATGYSVIATDALSRHRGGVALFYRPTPVLKPLPLSRSPYRTPRQIL